MAVVGTAALNIVPKFPGLSSAIKGALAQYDGTSAGSKAGTQYSGGFQKSASTGLVKSGAIVGAFAAITNKAMSTIAAHVGDASARFDTLNNYPRVMQSLGYSANDASASLSKMDKHIQGLPTTLQGMVSTVQGLAAATGDLEKATDAGLALNDMLIASGSSQQIVTAAAEQFRQMLSKGKPDMQDWKSLVQAAPGQMNQLAQSMLGPTANANDLYKALGGGGGEAILTMDDLLDAMIRLDKEGGQGFSSFESQARSASDGVQTSVARVNTAITRGLANTLKAIGKENIAGFLGDIKTGIDSTFNTINPMISSVMPVVKSLLGVIKEFAPQILATVGVFGILQAKSVALNNVITSVGQAFRTSMSANIVSGMGNIQKAMSVTAGVANTFKTTAVNALKSLASPANIATLAITGIVAAVSLGIKAYQNWKTNTENAQKATQGLTDAVSRTGALDQYSGKIANIGSVSKDSAMSINDLNASIASSVDKMNETASEAENQIATLNTAQQIIQDCAGATDLSTDAQGRLQWALSQVNEQFGLNITAQDVMNGTYTDQNGVVQDLTSSIDNLIAKKKEEIRLNALQDQYTEALKNQAEAQKTFAAEYQKAWESNRTTIYEAGKSYGMTWEEAGAKATEAMSKTKLASQDTLDSTTKSVSDLEDQMGQATKATSEAADAYDKFTNSLGAAGDLLKQRGQSITSLTDSLRNLGANTEDLSHLGQEQLMQLAQAYDGTSASIVDLLDQWDVKMDEGAKKAAKSADEIKASLESMKSGANGAFDGIDLTTFSQKLADAGVSTEQLNAIGTENLTSLANACNGNMDMMVWAIQHYNDTQIVDKDGNILVDQAELLDAQGNVYVWNGTTLVNKATQATCNSASLVDGQGRVYTWNGTNLEYKSGTADSNTGGLQSGLDMIDRWNNSWLKPITGRITAFISQVSENAAGGIRLHADGGIVPRYHASGGHIATKAVPLDIVGEAGAEAIVPLTNRKYSQPFVDLLADGINQKNNNDDLIAAIMVLHNDLKAIFSIIPENMSKRDRERFVRRTIAQV